MTAKPPHLTKEQRNQLKILEPELKACISTADLKTAKKVAKKILGILRPTGHNTRLLQAKNWLYECAMEAGETEFAISGFSGTRELVSTQTRVYLEATVLLSICLIRRQNYVEAQPLIREALSKINNIKSHRKRRQFHKRLNSRLEDESILSGLVSFDTPKLNIDEIDREAVTLIQTKTNDELFELLGNSLPDESILLLETSRDFFVKGLPAPDRKYLPPPIKRQKPIELGKRVTVALKRVVWRTVCDNKSEIYQAWSQGLSIVYDKKYLTMAVASSLVSWRIGASMIAPTIVALVIKLGAEVFCEAFAPESIMIDRKE